MHTKPIIVVAIDFSEAASAVYRSALQLAKASNAALRLLHVAEKGDWETTQQAREWLRLRQLREDDLTTLTGTPWVQIVRYCEAARPMVLVVGSYGWRGYQPLEPGSTTTRLLVRSPVPLMVVPMRPPALARAHAPRNPQVEQRSPHA